MKRLRSPRLALSVLGFSLAFSGGAIAQPSFNTYTESEPNDTKATADAFFLRDLSIASGGGDRIAGVAGPGDIDRFRITMANTYGFQANLLRNNQTTQQGGLHGLALTAAGTADPTSDPLVQVAAPYGFAPGSDNFFITAGVTNGPGQTVDYEIAGTGANTLYTSRAATYPLYDGSGVIFAGNFQGRLTITAGSETIDSDIALFGRVNGTGQLTGQMLKANNDASPTTFGSRIYADYRDGGEFTLAVSDSNLVTGLLPDADEFARAANDPRTHVFGDVGVLAASSSATVSIPITIRDDYGHTFSTTYQKSGYGIGLFRISSVPAPVPEPATLAALGLGAITLLRRRRNA